MAYLTLFPIGVATRINLFAYRAMNDPWLRAMRNSPRETLATTMPGFCKLIGDFEVVSDVKIRPVDLYVTKGHRQAGVVLAGDAFATSCPAAGTGANKVFCDVERLCNVYIPHWLASGGMGEEKIAAFYDDPVKRANDELSESQRHISCAHSQPTQELAGARGAGAASSPNGASAPLLAQVSG